MMNVFQQQHKKRVSSFPFFLCLFFLIFSALLVSSPASAAIEIELEKQTSPNSTKPGKNDIKLKGKSVFTDAIDPSAVTIILTPEIPADGEGTNVSADRVRISPAKKEKNQKIRFFFTVPDNLLVIRPTLYSVSVSVTTVTGETFSSVNSSSMKIKPNKGIVSVNPSDNGPGIVFLLINL